VRHHAVSGNAGASAFQVVLRVNFISGQGETGTTKFIGSEGVLDMNDNHFTITHHKMARLMALGMEHWKHILKQCRKNC